MPDAVAALAAIRAVAVDMQAISATLRALQGGYAGAAPCMLQLLERVDHVNQSVLALPAGLRGDVELLRRAKVGGRSRHSGHASCCLQGTVHKACWRCCVLLGGPVADSCEGSATWPDCLPRHVLPPAPIPRDLLRWLCRPALVT